MDISKMSLLFSDKLSQEDKSKLLLEAIENNNTLLIDKWIETDVNLSAIDKNSRGILEYAAYHGNISILTFLLDKKSFDQNSKEGRTLLHFAVLKSQTEAVAFLLERGANLEAADNNCNTPLHFAAHQSQIETVAFLLERGANLAAANNYGNTPLHVATDQGQIETVALLLAKGANLQAVNKQGQTPFHLALGSGHVKTVAFLCQNGVDLNQEELSPLIKKASSLTDDGNMLFCLLTFISADKFEEAFQHVKPELYKAYLSNFDKEVKSCAFKLHEIARALFFQGIEGNNSPYNQPKELLARQLELCFPVGYQHLIPLHLDLIYKQCFAEVEAAKKEPAIEIESVIKLKEQETGIEERFNPEQVCLSKEVSLVSSQVSHYLPSFLCGSEEVEIKNQTENKKTKRKEDNEGPEFKKAKIS